MSEAPPPANSQPFYHFMHSKISKPAAPGEPAHSADPDDEKPDTPLAEGLRNDMGPSSSTRSIARTLSAKSLGTAPDQTRDILTPSQHFQLEGPAGRETQGNTISRNGRNIASLADIIKSIDGRISSLERHMTNLETTVNVRTQRSCSPRDRRSRRSSGSDGSEDSVSSTDLLREQVEDMEGQLASLGHSLTDHGTRMDDLVSRTQILDDLESRTRILETRVAPAESPDFSLLEMTTALEQQFHVVRDKHDDLRNIVRSHDEAISKAGNRSEQVYAEIQTAIRRLESTVARLQLTSSMAPPPAGSRSRAHSPPPLLSLTRRASSPEIATRSKRFRAEETYILMGPITSSNSVPPLDVLRVYLAANLPTYALPNTSSVHVTWDSQRPDHLHIVMNASEVRAFKTTWDAKTINKGSIRVSAFGLEEASGSTSGRNGGNFGGTLGGRYSSGTFGRRG
ncbi:hypothetical protein R3P38DRAFT_3146360 [Favolaschia claudopus]|uniref:Uncharacterized protein n=1 Tax=Favolaschia claudopus TaxID=2862362 RepID=A0AAV9Z369_9AGAR